MLGSGMSEGLSNSVAVEADPAELQAMLRFIYLGELDATGQQLPGVLELAHKYEAGQGDVQTDSAAKCCAVSCCAFPSPVASDATICQVHEDWVLTKSKFSGFPMVVLRLSGLSWSVRIINKRIKREICVVFSYHRFNMM